jgi:hypothetical protein
MREYLKIAVGTETQFFHRYYKQLPSFGDLRNEAAVRRLVREMLAERYFQRTGNKFGFDINEDMVISHLPEPTYRGVLLAIFNQLAVQWGMQRWGDKTPEYVHHLPILHELFPDAQYVHIVRDGRDVALSVFGRYFGAKSIYAAACEWRDAVSLVRKFGESVPADRFIELRYEDLLTNPRGWFGELMQYLGIDDPNNQLLDHITAHVPAELKQANFGKWKAQFRPNQREIYERVAGDLLRAYDYEVQIDKPRPFGALRQSLWKLDNRLRIWGTPSYWPDQYYRAKIRLKDLRIRLQGLLTGR